MSREDPKGALGGLERVHALARRDLLQDAPEAFDFFARMYVPLSDLESVMAAASNSSYEEAVAAYIKANPKRIDYWVTGKVD